MDAPILLVVDEDQAVLEALSGDLGRRFGVDYRILTESARRPAARPPLFLETSLPGVFAAGDLRHRSVKRVASAGGEGAIAVQLIHHYLAEAEG
jgi:thioredoxin reductase